MAEAGTPAQTGTAVALAASRGQLVLALRCSPLVIAMLVLAVIASGAMRGTAAVVMAALMAVLAATTSQALIWLGLRQTAGDAPRANYFFWSFVPAVLVYALGAGLVMMSAIQAPTQPTGLKFTANDLAALVCTCVFQIWLVLNVVRGIAREIGQPWSIPAHFATRDPIRHAVLVETAATCVCLLIGMLALIAARYLDVPAADALGALAIGLVLAAIAARFALETRRLVAGIPVSAAHLHTLTESIGKAAEKSGAIRQVLDVDAVHMGPASILATVQLDFKEGVSASHVAPVLEKLRAAVLAAQPDVTDVVLAPPPSKTAAKVPD